MEAALAKILMDFQVFIWSVQWINGRVGAISKWLVS